MNKSDKIIIFFYVFLAFSYGFYVFTYSEGLDETLLEVVLPKKITDFETTRLVDVPKNRLFDVMADIENFSNVLPKNIIYVNILNKTDTEIIAEEQLSEAGIKVKLLVKHTITPYSKHVIEIIDGDAKGTTIIQHFESVNSQTKLTTSVNLNLKGVTSVVAYLPQSNLVHALNTVISHFVEYSKYDIYEKTVDSIYLEVLHRSADKEGLLHYSTLLRNEQITEQELKNILFNSDELHSPNMKTIDELNPETINVISGLYENFLLREADPDGLQYYGNLFENGTTYDELRTLLLDSNEGQSLSLLHPVRNEIIIVYKLLFDKQPEKFEVDHYHKMIDDGLIIIPDWAIDILSYRQDGLIPVDEASNAIKYLHNEGIILIDEIPSIKKLLEYKN